MTTPLTPWKAGNNGTGARAWFVFRRVTDHPRGMAAEFHERADGHLRRYGSREAAQRVADYLNAIGDRVDPGWGEPYGASEQPHYVTHEGVGVWMHRKGQRVRFYNRNGREHGIEQPNVAQAIVYAAWCGWRDPSRSEAANDLLRSEVRTKTTFGGKR